MALLVRLRDYCGLCNNFQCVTAAPLYWAFDCLIEKGRYRAIEKAGHPIQAGTHRGHTHTSIFIVHPSPLPIHPRHNSGKVINLQYWGGCLLPPIILDLPLLFIPLKPFATATCVEPQHSLFSISTFSIFHRHLPTVTWSYGAGVDYLGARR